MNVKEIVEKYLKENGYDGLLYEDCQCACFIQGRFAEDCYGSCCMECLAGYKHFVNDCENTGETGYSEIICLQKKKNNTCKEECDYYKSCKEVK